MTSGSMSEAASRAGPMMTRATSTPPMRMTTGKRKSAARVRRPSYQLAEARDDRRQECGQVARPRARRGVAPGSGGSVGSAGAGVGVRGAEVATMSELEAVLAPIAALVAGGCFDDRLTCEFFVAPWRGRFGGVCPDPAVPSFGESVTVGKPSRGRRFGPP